MTFKYHIFTPTAYDCTEKGKGSELGSSYFELLLQEKTPSQSLDSFLECLVWQGLSREPHFLFFQFFLLRLSFLLLTSLHIVLSLKFVDVMTNNFSSMHHLQLIS